MESSNLSKTEYIFICVTRFRNYVIILPLIDVLTHYISPFALYKKIQSCPMLITGKNKLSPDQLKVCFPEPPLLPDYKTFDFPLLYGLIRHLCPSLRPTQGWGIEPRCTHTLIGDEIERLRLLKNYMFTCQPPMSEDKFPEFLNRVRSVFRIFQNFTKSWSNYNYEQELRKIVPEKLGYTYPKKGEQPEKVLLTSDFSDKKGNQIFNKNRNQYVTQKNVTRKMF